MTRFFSILICVFFVFVRAFGAKNVTIQKCCKLDEDLTTGNKCIRKDSNVWNLNVYSQAKKIWLPKNSIPPSNWVIKENTRPICSHSTTMPQSANSYLAFQNGSLFVPTFDAVYHPNDFCLDYRVAIICNPNRPGEIAKHPAKKCCGKDAIFTETKQTCMAMKEKHYDIRILKDDRVLSSGFPHCPEARFAVAGEFVEENVFANGSLFIPDIKVTLPPTNYCLEYIFENSAAPKIIVCHEQFINPDVVVSPPPQDIRFILYPIGLAISSVFLAATLISGYFLPATHHVLHWRCQTNHVICLLMGDILLCVIQLTGRMNDTVCIILAEVMHFLFLAAFFWLNTMCFNIWWTFRDLRPQSMERNQERWRLRICEMYAWGIPFLIALAAGVLHYTQGDTSVLLAPRFGENTCWLNGNLELLTFFYGPIGLLLIINLVLFTMTARELTCGLWKRELVNSTTERAALDRVCIKLVVVMGVTWIADVLSWAAGGPKELWYLTDVINSLQGVFIFIVIGCQPQVISAAKKWWCFKRHRENGTAGTTNHHSSSSQGSPSMGDSITNNTKSIPLETNC